MARVPIPRKDAYDLLERHQAWPVLVLLREAIAREGLAALAGSGATIPPMPPAIPTEITGAEAERMTALRVISLVDQVRRPDTTYLDVVDDDAWPLFQAALHMLAANSTLTGVTQACVLALLTLAQAPDPAPADPPPPPPPPASTVVKEEAPINLADFRQGA